MRPGLWLGFIELGVLKQRVQQAVLVLSVARCRHVRHKAQLAHLAAGLGTWLQGVRHGGVELRVGGAGELDAGLGDG
jgi:hypothetical protein